MFHRVLVATGGSPWSDNAIKYAIGLARDYHLDMVILHVLTETPPYFVAEAGTSLDSLLEGSEEAGRRIVDEAADWAVKRLGDWGLANANTEKWKFGKGWSLSHFQAHLLEPQRQPLQ